MKDLPHIKGRRYITNLVAEGEHLHQDFKFAISDARKIARSVSAFANADGGHLLIGVKDNGTLAGVRGEEDVYMVELAASRYCDPPQEVEFTAFSVDSNVVVIRASIAKAAKRPVRANEPDGTWRAYYRVADENIVAHKLMVRAWQHSHAISLNLDGDATRLIDFVRSCPEGTDARAIALALHISEKRAEQLVVSLAAAQVLDFTYQHSEFRITAH